VKLSYLHILYGAGAATAGTAVALALVGTLGTAVGVTAGLLAAAAAGGIGAFLGGRTIERLVAARVAALDPTGEHAAGATPAEPTGWAELDSALGGVGQALKRLAGGRAELEEFERLINSVVASTGDAFPAGAAGARQGLQALLGELGRAAGTVVEAAGVLGEATERIASGASQQSGAIVRTTTTVEALSDQIDRISRNAEEAAESSEQARGEARRGLEQVQGAIEGMDRLRAHVDANGRKVRRLGDRSVEIGTIIDLITGISQRTDMLALNATIESVRAGEHGRGFAVVAEEIRKLAERAAMATREIGTLVEAIQGDTQESIKAIAAEQAEVEAEAVRVREAGAALERISEYADRSARLVDGISQSTQGQVRATQDLVVDAQQISEIAQQALDGATRAREHVRDLSQRCSKLQRLASLGGVTPPRPAPADGHEPKANGVRRGVAVAGRTQ
jgi:twitching motility protein PilJ